MSLIQMLYKEAPLKQQIWEHKMLIQIFKILTLIKRARSGNELN